jgi:soluble cytochrome b562
MGPIIQALNTPVAVLKIKGAPKSFQELIGQLDEVSKYIRSGALVNVREVQAVRGELV